MCEKRLSGNVLDGENALQIINDLSELVYLVDPKTYELLYINRTCAEQFQIKDCRGQKCYQLLHGKTEPCDFCNNDQLTHSDCLCWNCYNTVVNRYYQLKDKLINLDGRDVKMEIACDVTELEKQRLTLENNLHVEAFVNDCSRELSNLREPEQALLRTLEKLGSYLHSDRVYIYETIIERKKNTFEWCAHGREPNQEVFHQLRVNLFDYCQKTLKENECLLIKNVEDIRDYRPKEYDSLTKLNIHSLIICPLMEGGKLIGYIGADNYLAEVEDNLLWLLSSIGYFVSVMLQHLMMIDVDLLTQTYNHNRFIRDLEKKIDFPAGIVYIDINGMKQMNDDKGHSFGDSILSKASKKIKETFPEGASYRIGGDEFVVIVPNIEEDSFDMKVQTLKGEFSHASKIKASVGRKWSAEQAELPDLVRAADEQMYKDKKNFYRGRELSRRYRGPLDQIRELSCPSILEQKLASGKFLVYYQPKFQTSSESLTGAEALIRYIDDHGTMHFPIKFVPYLEEKGLISALDYYVFGQVCRQLRQWIEQGIQPVPVAINFSRYTLEKEGFVNKIISLCDEFDAPKEYIEIEVTETTEALNAELFYLTLAQLRNKGFRIAIDDFGARHANLNLLIDMDFDVLKIDMHVIKNLNAEANAIDDRLAKSDKCRLLIETVTRICNQSGIRTVAEGVEDIGQLNLLKQVNCKEVQGFLFSSPIPVTAFFKNYLLPNQQH